VQPYAEEQLIAVQERDDLSEEGYDEAGARRLLEKLMHSRQPTAVCSHRPVLPELFGLLGIHEEPLAPAELVVAHHRRGEIVATERHLPR
jgi:8-oxo-dGTP diphosphatase